MITKYCSYDMNGKCFCNLADSHHENIDLCVCERCNEYVADETFNNYDERVKEYKGE